MFKLLRIFQNYSTTTLFLLLQFVGFFLLIRFNHGQKTIFLHSSNQVVSSFIKKKSKLYEYLNLNDHNDELLVQNAKLIQELINKRGWTIEDSISTLQFDVIPCNVINNSISTRNNYLTLDRGFKDGVKKASGLIGMNGVVGIVNQTSENYSTALSTLNVNLRISAAIADKNFAGYLIWPGNDINIFELHGIPKHADISVGDKVVTSGYSAVFPPNIPLGQIEKFNIIEGGAFYEIIVKSEQTFADLTHAYIIINYDSEEIRELEKSLD